MTEFVLEGQVSSVAEFIHIIGHQGWVVALKSLTEDTVLWFVPLLESLVSGFTYT